MLNYLQQNIDITELSWFKTKAITSYYFEINNQNDIEKLSEIYNFCKVSNIKFYIIWGWTNTMFAFDKFNWVIIKNNLTWLTYDEKTKILDIYTQNNISDIALYLEEKLNNDLWHRFIGLPGSVWWAVFWNAGCFGLETESNFVSAKILDLSTWEIKDFSKNDSKFDYRSSLFKNDEKYFIISVIFDLSLKQEKYSSDVDNIDFRENKQPKWNSCGSFFKNPNKDNSAWKLIELVWLKWFTYNCAYFSEKHANFLMTNKDNWDYRDLLYVMELAQEKVKSEYWFELENEVRILKN